MTNETDPPVAKPSKDAKAPQRKTVRIVSAGGYELPSGSTFLLAPGHDLEVTAEDAQWLLDNGLAE